MDLERGRHGDASKSATAGSRRWLVNYCGIDLAGVSSYVYVTDARGKRLAAGEVGTDKAAFERRLKRFVRGGLAIAIEAGNQTAWVHDALVALGATVTVVTPAQVKLIAESRR